MVVIPFLMETPRIRWIGVERALTGLGLWLGLRPIPMRVHKVYRLSKHEAFRPTRTITLSDRFSVLFLFHHVLGFPPHLCIVMCVT